MADGPEYSAVPPESRRDALDGLRRHLDAALESAEPREVAALSREKRAVMAELAALPNPAEVDGVVDLRDRIARKQAGQGVHTPAVSGNVRAGGS